ncbi:pimeloyl-ACP methyl ester carboxylesterase [Evansella vedderi]|uniref:prolyl aminopeptidase n=1 Tax=Evansella vedderi TaxID=38282 RepID=A0ABT9ZR62_9BACI|nr:alpha/beta hydrolase [Evansella vedderi]MDQ0253445.1 pimeloyl-ACP methyl ester carboxylesterase [Evansella vedderi]
MEDINYLETIEINNSKQWVYIRSQNQYNPIILFLHGGPGASQIYCADKYFKALEHHFILVDWDQRGSGKSYSRNTSKESVSINQYVEDIRVLTEVLKKRFNKEKLYLVGHSWGSVIGLLAVEKYPELFHSYIGIGQVINLVEGEMRGYEYVLEQSKLKNDTITHKKLNKIGPPPYNSLFKTAIVRKLVDKYGGYKYQQKTKLWNDYLKEMLESKHYSLLDIVKWFKGTNYLVKRLNNELLTINFFEQVKKVEIPIYFLAGRFDYITPSSLVEEYFEMVDSPHKEMIFFENEAHDLHFENTNKFFDVCLKICNKP